MASEQPKTKIDPLANFIPCNLFEAERHIVRAFNSGWVPNLISSPGVGKSSVVKQVAERLELLLIDVRLSQIDPTELNGFPHIFEDEQGHRKAGYIPMDIYPIVGDELPINPKTDKPYKGWLLFLDEFNAATPNVQVAAYKVVLDHMIGCYMLHEKCYIATAGNLITDKAIVHRQSTATQSRIIHLPIYVCNDTWALWANANDVDQRVISYIAFRPAKLHDFDPNHQELTFPCPRTWEMLSDGIKKLDPIPKKDLTYIAGCIGAGTAREFWGYTQVYQKLPDINEILANPRHVNIPDRPDIQYAMSGLVGKYLNADNADDLIQFLMRLGIDFQVVALRQAVARNVNLMKNKAVSDWIKHNTKELIRNRA